MMSKQIKIQAIKFETIAGKKTAEDIRAAVPIIKDILGAMHIPGPP